MTAAEFREAREPDRVSLLLDRVESRLTADYQRTAYNFLVDYLENPSWFTCQEGRRLILLSIEVLSAIP